MDVREEKNVDAIIPVESSESWRGFEPCDPQLFQCAALNDILGRSLENCHSQGVPFCTEMDGHRRVLIVFDGVPVAVHSLVQSATSLSDVRSVASDAADEGNNRRGLASK